LIRLPVDIIGQINIIIEISEINFKVLSPLFLIIRLNKKYR